MKEKTTELPVMYFKHQQEWENWLSDNHTLSAGVRVKIAKKGAGTNSVTYAEALEIALCYGWIDSRKEAFDDKFWLQRFTPRKPGSIWSKINKEKSEQLIAAGKMKPSGQHAIEQAKANGQWDKAYVPQSSKDIPKDLEEALNKKPKARSFFETLNSVNRYAIIFRISNAKKAETCQRRIEKFLDMLEKGEKIHP